MKLYDGRGQRFKKLIGLKQIKQENKLKKAVVIPKHARAKWYWIWLRWFLGIIIPMALAHSVISLGWYAVTKENIIADEFFDMIIGTSLTAFFLASYVAVFAHLFAWKSKAVALQTLPKLGFCPNCGYIIRDTPAESDGCTPCGECGHAWRVGT